LKLKSLLNLATLASDPVGSVGDVFFNTTEKALKIHNGTTWIILSQNTDPAPFYMHTHTFDGDVHTIDIENPITFREINTLTNVSESLPKITGFDGGAPSSNVEDPNFSELSLLDGGTI
jgi:hypothetical protein